VEDLLVDREYFSDLPRAERLILDVHQVEVLVSLSPECLDWDALSRQKATLVRLRNEQRKINGDCGDVENLSGLLHLLDHIQDTAVNLGIDEAEVFPNLEEK